MRIFRSPLSDKKDSTVPPYAKKHPKKYAKSVFGSRRELAKIKRMFQAAIVLYLFGGLFLHVILFFKRGIIFFPLHFEILWLFGFVILFMGALKTSTFESEIRWLLRYEEKTGEKIIPDEYRDEAEKLREKYDLNNEDG